MKDIVISVKVDRSTKDLLDKAIAACTLPISQATFLRMAILELAFRFAQDKNLKGKTTPCTPSELKDSLHSEELMNKLIDRKLDEMQKPRMDLLNAIREEIKALDEDLL